MKPILITLLLLSMLLAGCTPSGPNIRPDSETLDPTVLSDRGQYGEAAQRWLELARQADLSQPDSAALARLAAAEAWLQANEADQAQLAIVNLETGQFDQEQRFRLDLVQAELALLNGDFETAGWILATPLDQIPPPLQQRFAVLSEQLIQLNPDSIQARIGSMRTALNEGSFEPPMALSLLLDQPLASLQNAFDQAQTDADLTVLPWLELALSARRFLLDDAERNQAFIRWQQEYQQLGWSAQAAEQSVQAWKATRARPDRIAVLLPGQGPLLRAGEVLRNGLVSAWLNVPESDRPQLLFYYLDDRPDAAVGALFQARDDGADALIGPLDRRQIGPLLELPDAGLPMLLLNRPVGDGLWLMPSRSISILALPPEEEAELAAVHALVQGYRRALVVAQGSDWGARVGNRFIETFELGGGRVLARTDYDDQSFDHTERLEMLLQLDQSERRIAALKNLIGDTLESQPQRRSDIELIFMATPDGDALQVLPQLRFLDADDLAIYATSHVLNQRGNLNDLQGIEFPIAPWLLPETDAGRLRERVQQQFPSTASLSLSQLHALGRDALALMPWLEEMKLDRQLYLAGQIGRLRLSDGTTFERDLPWARIDQGRVVQD